MSQWTRNRAVARAWQVPVVREGMLLVNEHVPASNIPSDEGGVPLQGRSFALVRSVLYKVTHGATGDRTVARSDVLLLEKLLQRLVRLAGPTASCPAHPSDP